MVCFSFYFVLCFVANGPKAIISDEKKLNITPYPKYESHKEAAPTRDMEKAVESQPAGITSSVGGMVLPSAARPRWVNFAVFNLSSYANLHTS